MDFPTANPQPDASVILPAAGVYATETELPDGRRFLSVTNVGTRPTVDRSDRVTVESHLIGLSEDLYGQTVRIWFREKLREIRRFGSLQALSGQIRLDAEETVRRSGRRTPLWTAEPTK